MGKLSKVHMPSSANAPVAVRQSDAAEASSKWFMGDPDEAARQGNRNSHRLSIPASETRPCSGDMVFAVQQVILVMLRGGGTGVIGQDAQAGADRKRRQGRGRTWPDAHDAVLLVGAQH